MSKKSKKNAELFSVIVIFLIVALITFVQNYPTTIGQNLVGQAYKPQLKPEVKKPEPPIQVIACTDSDGGEDYYTKGIITGPLTTDSTSTTTKEDYCKSSTSLVEYVCHEGLIGALDYSCTCSDGACSVQDSDNDGLTDTEEESIGTDPLDIDTDDDTFSDGDEIDSGTDPLDADDPSQTTQTTYTVSNIVSGKQTVTAYDDKVLDEIEELLGFDSSKVDMADYLLINGDPDDADDSTYLSNGGLETMTIDSTKVNTYSYETSVVVMGPGGADGGDFLNFYYPEDGAIEGLYVFNTKKSTYNPTNWFVLEAYIDPMDKNSKQLIISKQTESTCEEPTYALYIDDGEYYFTVTIDGVNHIIEGGNVETDWQKVTGVYISEKTTKYMTGEATKTLYLYVNDEQKAMSRSTTSDSLTTSTSYDVLIGLCILGEHDFEGYLEYVRFWGN